LIEKLNETRKPNLASGYSGYGTAFGLLVGIHDCSDAIANSIIKVNLKICT
jgi:hypothetical protein